MSLLVVEVPFNRAVGYTGKFAYLPAGLEVDTVRVSQTTIAAPEYSDTFFTILHQGKEYLIVAATDGSVKWPTWTSTWAASYSAGMTGEFHMLGRLSYDTYGDYLILAAE